MWVMMSAAEREEFLADVRVGVLSAAAGKPGRTLAVPVWYSYQREGYQPLRPVRAVGQPGRDLPGPVPVAQGGAGGAGFGGRALERDPVRALELGVQLEFEFPVVEAVFPVH